MPAHLEEKAERYERLLAEAIEAAAPAGRPASPIHEAGEDCLDMARSYLDDGRHFDGNDDPVNALAAFSYGHGWLDAGARIGVLEVPVDGELFTV